jgi:hypothetical protein
LNVDLKDIVDSKCKRRRKRPERFSGIKWTDSGKRGVTISAEELRAREAIALGEGEDGSSDDDGKEAHGQGRSAAGAHAYINWWTHGRLQGKEQEEGFG